MGRYTEEILRTVGKKNVARDIVSRGPRNAAKDIIMQRQGWPQGASGWAELPSKPAKTTGKWVVALYKRNSEEHTGGFSSRQEAEKYAKLHLGERGVADYRIYEEEA